MARLGKREVLGLEQVSPEEQVEGYRKVTSKQIQELAEEIFSQKPGIALVSSCSDNDLETLFN